MTKQDDHRLRGPQVCGPAAAVAEPLPPQPGRRPLVVVPAGRLLFLYVAPDGCRLGAVCPAAVAHVGGVPEVPLHLLLHMMLEAFG